MKTFFIIFNSLLVRSTLILPDISADEDIRSSFPQPFCCSSSAFIIKPHPVHQRLVCREPEQPWLFIAGLGEGSDGTYFYETKSQAGQLINIFCIFIKPRSEPDGIFKIKSEYLFPECRARNIKAGSQHFFPERQPAAKF